MLGPLNLVTPQQKKKRKGNPTWGKGGGRIAEAAPTEFEKVCQEMKVSIEDCLKSIKVRKWIREHANNRYIPEHVLLKLGMYSFEGPVVEKF